MNVADWLRGLGLDEYVEAFASNEIDASVLPSLTSEDLKEVGVVKIGHRRRLLDAIAALKEEDPEQLRAVRNVRPTPSAPQPFGSVV